MMSSENKKKIFDFISNNHAFCLTALTLSALAYSFLFNYGYSRVIGYEFLSLLTFQDYLESTIPLFAVALTLFVLMLWGAINNNGTFFDIYSDLFKVTHPWRGFLNIAKNTLEIIFTPPAVLFAFAIIYLIHIALGWWIYQFYKDVLAQEWVSSDKGFLEAYLYIAALIMIVFEAMVLIKWESHELRAKLSRFIVWSLFLTFCFGFNYAWVGVKNEVKWSIEMVDKGARTDLKVLRFLNRGLLTYNVNRKAIEFLPWQKVNGFSKLYHVAPKKDGKNDQ